MSRQYINQLGDRQAVDEVYRAFGKQLRPNRNGDLYLQIELSDRTGNLSARLWNAQDTLYQSFENGDYLRVEGTSQMYQGEMQMIAKRISRVEAETVDEADFAPQSGADVDRLLARLQELLRSISDGALRAVAECYLIDETFMAKFTRCPAGIKNHHAYFGGLLEHVVTMMELSQRVAEMYPILNADMLVMGAFLHDLGKVDELSYEHTFSYSDEGQLIGHLVMGVSILETKVREAEELLGEPIPQETKLLLKHMIVSHHGQYEFGSPKLPMTLEAIALWQLDNLDAKLQSFHQQMCDDPNIDSPWTLYNAQTGRKLYKGQPKGAQEPQG